jgi:Fibronectin type III domain
VEVQYLDGSKFTPKNAERVPEQQTTTSSMRYLYDYPKKPKESNWKFLVIRYWEYGSMENFVFERIPPGSSYYFRLRVVSHEGFSDFSEASAKMTTLASVPSQPIPPVVVVAMPDCMQLRWSRPRANGSKIKNYILRVRAMNEEFREVYRGTAMAFLVMSLKPDTAYSFDVAAENGVGISEFSEMASAKTSVMKEVDESLRSPEMQAALLCREAWTECWDPQLEQYFYYNLITGTRQLEKPIALKAKKQTRRRKRQPQ